jgi:voltage-gated potassium channel
VHLVTSLNRGMKVLGAVMRRRAFGYVMALTALILVAGAAGIDAFENDVPRGLDSYWMALWWTAMVLVTASGDYAPQTPEGRLLQLLLALYAYAGYSYFIRSTFSSWGSDHGGRGTTVAAESSFLPRK